MESGPVFTTRVFRFENSGHFHRFVAVHLRRCTVRQYALHQGRWNCWNFQVTLRCMRATHLSDPFSLVPQYPQFNIFYSFLFCSILFLTFYSKYLIYTLYIHYIKYHYVADMIISAPFQLWSWGVLKLWLEITLTRLSDLYRFVRLHFLCQIVSSSQPGLCLLREFLVGGELHAIGQLVVADAKCTSGAAADGQTRWRSGAAAFGAVRCRSVPFWPMVW